MPSSDYRIALFEQECAPMAWHELNRDEVAELNRHVRGSGGFESLMRRLQSQLNNATREIRLSADDIAALQKCAFDYEGGGFQDRRLAIFGRVLGPRLGLSVHSAAT